MNIDIIPGFSLIDHATEAIPMLAELRITDYVLTFFIYSALGWLGETIYCSVGARKFINRGFLTGPLCPIYGTGGLVFSLALTRFSQRWYLVLLFGVILADIVEYLTSYLMEKLFHARWWDYSHEILNLNGRICLKHTLYWGIASLLYIYFFQASYLELYTLIPQRARYIALGVVFVIFILDLINAARNAMDVKSFMGKLSSISDSLSELKNRFSGARDGDRETVSQVSEQLNRLRPAIDVSSKDPKTRRVRNRMYAVYENLRKSADKSMTSAEELLGEIKKHFTDDNGEMF